MSTTEDSSAVVSAAPPLSISRSTDLYEFNAKPHGFTQLIVDATTDETLTPNKVEMILKSLPKAQQNLVKLELLGLSCNHSNIWGSLQNRRLNNILRTNQQDGFHKLTHLILDGSIFESLEIARISSPPEVLEAISALHSLEYLSLRNNFLACRLDEVARALKDLSYLEHLDLSDNGPLPKDSLHVIAPLNVGSDFIAFRQLDALSHLNLSNSHLSDKAALRLAFALEDNPHCNLKHLDLSRNGLQQHHNGDHEELLITIALSSLIGRHSLKIRHIDLGGNPGLLKGDGAAILAPAIRMCHELEYLGLADTGLTDAAKVITAASDLKSLRCLDLSQNKLLDCSAVGSPLVGKVLF